MKRADVTRRGLLAAATGAGGLLLAGCDKLSRSEKWRETLGIGEDFNLHVQRLISKREALAPEFSARDISPVFKANGSQMPPGAEYAAMLANNFADWRLAIDGLVTRPLSLSLAELRRLPARTQVTRHDCVEGWSAIGGWTGVPLALLLRAAGVQTAARYAVFHCADNLSGEPGKGGIQSPGQYYESVDLIDAFHPQTILAYALNGQTLPVKHGAPLRLRVERQLGYKQAKYLMRIELTSSLAQFAGGKGGYWEDRGYEWYAGI